MAYERDRVSEVAEAIQHLEFARRNLFEFHLRAGDDALLSLDETIDKVIPDDDLKTIKSITKRLNDAYQEERVEYDVGRKVKSILGGHTVLEDDGETIRIFGIKHPMFKSDGIRINNEGDGGIGLIQAILRYLDPEPTRIVSAEEYELENLVAKPKLVEVSTPVVAPAETSKTRFSVEERRAEINQELANVKEQEIQNRIKAVKPFAIDMRNKIEPLVVWFYSEIRDALKDKEIIRSGEIRRRCIAEFELDINDPQIIAIVNLSYNTVLQHMVYSGHRINSVLGIDLQDTMLDEDVVDLENNFVPMTFAVIMGVKLFNTILSKYYNIDNASSVLRLILSMYDYATYRGLMATVVTYYDFVNLVRTIFSVYLANNFTLKFESDVQALENTMMSKQIGWPYDNRAISDILGNKFYKAVNDENINDLMRKIINEYKVSPSFNLDAYLTDENIARFKDVFGVAYSLKHDGQHLTVICNRSSIVFIFNETVFVKAFDENLGVSFAKYGNKDILTVLNYIRE